MSKYFSTLTGLLLYINFTCFSQTTGKDCSTYYYATSFNHVGYTYSAQVVPLPHGEAAIGCIKGNIINVAKLSAKGDTLWDRLYDIPGSLSASIMKALLDVDGNLLFAINSNYFLKIDTSGNFVSGKRIQNNADLLLYKMALLSNGDKIIMFSNYAYGQAVLARFDKDLNTIKWCKYYSCFNPWFGDFCVDDDNIIFGGGCAEFEYNSDWHSFIGKIDGANGNLLAFKYYKADSSFSRIRGLYKCGNDYIANCDVYTLDAAGDTRAYIRFDHQLQIKNSKRITGYYNWRANDVTFNFLPQKDGSFYVAYGADWTLGLLYIDNNDTLKWVKDMPGLLSYPSDIEQFDNSSIFITGQQNYFNVGPNTYGSTNYVVKTDMNGKVGDCPTEQNPQAFLTDYSFTLAQNTMTVADTNLSVSSIQATVTDYSPDTYQQCVRVSTCDSLHLSGDTFTCNNAPLIIKATRNPGCSNPITWALSSYEAAQFQNKTDSTISVVFNKSGTYKIRAAINLACADSIRDSLTIHVNLSNALHLGTDTFLCPNTTMVLHAGNQFKSYTWQDGSADSIYNVTSAGRYYVTVTDYCNNTYSDTINISSNTDYNFHGGNDTSKCNNDTLTLVAQSGFTGYKWLPDYNMMANAGQKAIVFPSTDTSYIVSALSPAGCYVKDTIHVSVNYSPAISLGNDTSFCSGEFITLMAPANFQNYLWNTGATTSQITASTVGAYSVSATAFNGCISKDTLIVQHVYDLPAFSLGKDTALCENQSLDFSFNLAGASYLWNDGSTAATHHLTTSGKHWLTVSENGCKATDTLQLSYKPTPVVTLGKDTTLCEGVHVNLNVENSGATYEWQDKSRNSSYTVSKSGIYYATVTLNNCSNSDTIAVNYKSKPSFTFNDEPFICNGQQIKLSPVIIGANKYVWQDSSTASSLLINTGGTYTLTVTNECGSYSNSIMVIQGDCQLNMPNAFTPNNDGMNDIFRLKYPQFIKLFHMMVFNRFGEKVFETNNVNDGWDGKLKSIDQPAGVYVWMLSLTTNDGISQNYKGIITLLR
jgi:gliding motility-associated-like protein